MKVADRAARDAQALELFLGGANYLEIGKQLGLTLARAEQIVKRELAASAKRRLMLTDEALAVHQERHERLYGIQWAKAQAGDQRAAELCERMLARNAKLFGLAEEINPSQLPAPTTVAVMGSDETDEPQDDLAALRAARSGA